MRPCYGVTRSITTRSAITSVVVFAGLLSPPGWRGSSGPLSPGASHGCIIDAAPGPAARYETRESIELAFIAALQHLPPRQRAAVVLRDVLGFRTSEVAEMLDSSQDSVKSALTSILGRGRLGSVGAGGARFLLLFRGSDDRCRV